MPEITAPAENCSLEEKQQALRRALRSKTFSRSEQMRSFLQFVCEAEFRGESAGVTEYVIGTEVLQRPEGYSPAEDSSVRTRAYELRHKLERLYEQELTAEAVRIFIPKGAYSPQFQRNGDPAFLQQIPAKTTEFVSVAPALPAREARPRSFWVALLALTAVSCTAAGFLLQRSFPPSLTRGTTVPAEPGASDRIVREMWGALAQPNQQTLLVAATPLYLVLGPASHGAFGTETYPAFPEAYKLFRQHRPLPKNGRLGMVFTSDALGVGSMDAVIIASNTIRDLGGATEIVPERPSMMAAIHGRNAALFGAPVDSQLISDILRDTPLTVDYDDGSREFVIRDRVSGHLLIPEKTPEGDFRVVYGLVTVLNTRESNRGRLGLIVFSGITSVGTHGAAEFFASPASLSKLRDILGKSGGSHLPTSYQVVVRCKIENFQLVSETYETHRVVTSE